ncbi:hypothetical protein VNO78_21355 [Psophocarpus tetragonolobus]|uniref:DUF7780 domain-containing protein n=1 Tax=Psophocarpus tetragonolobus TaxID=3891 RepID=A0AAN9XHZ6_PSOTE
MGSFPKPNISNTNTHNIVMGFLLVFFPEDSSNPNPNPSHSSSTIASKAKFLSSPFQPSFKTHTSNNALLSKAQSTLSICFLLVFVTLLLFTLSTFEPSHSHTHQKKSKLSKLRNDAVFPSSSALQRMGTLYRRGTRAMNDVVVCHVTEDTTLQEFTLFLRLIHRSGLTAKSDVVFIFPTSSNQFSNAINEENNSFRKLVSHYDELLNSTHWVNSPNSPESTTLLAQLTKFDVARFLKPPKRGEPLWGRKKISVNYTGDDTELTRPSYGSVLSFEAGELDPENSLAGFLDRVPLSLRRWACYPMLLGRVRRSFKHAMLVDVKSVLILNDPLNRVRNRNPDSVLVYSKHGKNSGRTHLVNSAVLMGGARGIRRVSQAMLVAIVRAAVQHKKRNLVGESAILSQLVRNEFVLKNVELVFSKESVPEPSSLAGSKILDWSIIQRGTGNYDVNFIVKKQICSSVMDSFVYRDCKQ